MTLLLLTRVAIGQSTVDAVMTIAISGWNRAATDVYTRPGIIRLSYDLVCIQM